jgi:hypothetical protein
MALPANDNFNRADESPLNTSNWTAINGGHQVVSSAVQGVTFAYNLSYWSADAFAADHSTQVTLLAASDGGPAVRVSSGSNAYFLDIKAGNNTELKKLVGGSQTTLQGGLTTPAVNDTVYIEVVVSTIKVKVNGTQLGTDQADSSFSSGSAGLFDYDSNGRYDNFTADNIGGASGISAVGSVTLGGLTSSAAATVETHGSTTATLGALTASATATVETHASTSATLGALTSVATGTVASAGSINGSLTATLGSLTSVATATATVRGSVGEIVERYFLPSTGTPDVNPAFTAGWNKTTAAVRLPLSAIRSGTPQSNWSSNSSALTPELHLTAQHVGAPMTGAATMYGWAKGQIRAYENNAALNGTVAISIKVVSNDGSVVRGTLLSIQASVSTTTPPELAAASSGRNRSFQQSDDSFVLTLTPVTRQNGDRLVVETGFRDVDTSISRQAFVYYGDDASWDLDEGNTDTTNPGNAWLEFHWADPTKSLGALTSVATATVTGTSSERLATLSATLGALTGVSTATVAVSASATSTLGALTEVGVGSVEVRGVTTQTLGALTGVAAFSSLTGSIASGDATLGALGGVAAATVDIRGTLAVTLGALGGTETSTVSVGASLDAILGEMTATATAKVAVVGSVTATLGALTGTETATNEVRAVANITLDALTGTARGFVGSNLTYVDLVGQPTYAIGLVGQGQITLNFIGSAMAIESSVQRGQFFVGEDKVLRYEILEEGKTADDPTIKPTNVDGFTFSWTLRRVVNGKDPYKNVGTVVAQKTSEAGQINIVGIFNEDRVVNTQRVAVTLESADTAAITTGAQYVCALKRADSGFETVLSYGQFPMLIASTPS